MNIFVYFHIIFLIIIFYLVSEFRPRWVKHNEKVAMKKANKVSSELKTNQQILKDRLRRQKLKKVKGGKIKKGKGKGKGRKR